jgi:CBS domain-containing protein
VKSRKGGETVVRIYMVPIAEDVTTPDPYVVEVNEDATEVASIMLKHGISGLPVVE